MIPVIRGLVVGMTVLTSVALVSCSPVGTGESPSSTSSPLERDASGLGGAEVCIQNDSSLRMRVQWRGYPSAAYMAPGVRQCNSGLEETGTADVEGVLEYQPKSPTNHWSEKWTVIGMSEIEGPPKSGAWLPDYKGRYQGACGNIWKGQRLTFDNGVIHGEINLVDDYYELYKFELRITDSTGQRVYPDVTDCVTLL